MTVTVSEAKLGYGATLEWATKTVLELTRIGGVKLSASKQDSTRLVMGDYYKQFMPGLIDPGDVEIEGLFRPDDDEGQMALKADMESRTPRTAIIHAPTALSTFTWEFTAYCIGFETGDMTPEGWITFKATLGIVGQPDEGVEATTGLTDPWFEMSDDAIIVPDPAGDVYEYVATVLFGVTSVTITPTASGGQTITVNGNTVISGEKSSAIALGAPGSVTDAVIKVSYTGKSSKTYTIHIARAAGA